MKKTVHEYKAPTDDSIHLYKEMEEKARKSIVDAFKIENNHFTSNIVVNSRADIMNFQVNFNLLLNGKKIEGSFLIPEYTTRDAITELVARKFSEAITQEILKTLDSNTYVTLMKIPYGS